MNKKDLIKIKKILNAFLRKIAEHPFPTFLILSLIVLILGGLLFYQYSFLAQAAEPELKIKPIKFQEDFYQNILIEWQDREARLEEAESKQYFSPFQPGKREERKLSEERTQELLSNPLIQELLKASNLYEFYTTRGELLLTIEERAKIWEELDLGREEEYEGTYSQNIKFLSELKKELTK